MPYIEIKTSKAIANDAECEMTKSFGKAISIFQGKSERWLMLNFSGEERMAFAGKTEPSCAMISVSLFGAGSREEYDKFTEAACEIVSAIGIPKDRIYVKYSEYSTWGMGGENF